MQWILRAMRNVCLFFIFVLIHQNIALAKTPWLKSFTPENEFFVSPTGNGSGLSESDPMSLNSALSSASPGDCYWLMAGTYTGFINITRSGSSNNPIVFRALPGDRVTIVGGIEVNAANNWIWGLEITDPTGVAGVGGIQIFQDGVSAINNIIHDQFGAIGIGAWDKKNQIIYGNIVYSQNADGNNPHNVYAQNDYQANKYKYVVNNMILDATDATSSTYNFHAYAEGDFTSGIYARYNIVRNGKFLIGGYNTPADRQKVISNYFYNSNVKFGYGAPAQAIFKKNYIAKGTLDIEWFWGEEESQFNQSQNNSFKKNEIVNPIDNHIEFRTSAFTSGGLCTGCVAIRGGDKFDKNKYSAPFKAGFHADDVDLGNIDFSQWKTATENAGCSFDKNSDEDNSIDGTKIFVLPNDYESGRGHVAIYNWDGLSTIEVNLSSIVSNGSNFKVLDPRNVFGTVILSGVYTGPVNIPLGGQEFSAFLVVEE